jgi:Archaeal ATPase.
MLRESGYEVFYIHPLDEVFDAKVSFPDVKRAFMDFVEKALAENAVGRVVWAVFDFTRKILSIRRSRVAVVVDDAFQVIGVDKAAAYVKGLLNMIEHPVYDYDRMVVLVATSEGLSRDEIGRHSWAEITPIWNMPQGGFKQLYEKLPGPKPPFDDVWRLTGGNPRMLARLYQANWHVDYVLNRIINEGVYRGIS